VPRISEYAQRLMFEHCIAYAENLQEALGRERKETKPPVTFYDAMRAYMTGRQFIDVLSRNPDAILSAHAPSPPPSNTQMSLEDPLAPLASVAAPPFPVVADASDPVTRAVGTINAFTSILSTFGLRFGFTHWRDRFTRESSALSAQLYALKPTYPPPSQVQWSTSPQIVYPPTTPPGLFTQQHSPFSSAGGFGGGGFETSPGQQSMGYDGTSPGQQFDGTSPSMWGTPSPQVPDMPMPSGGRQRQAIVFGAGLPSPGGGGAVQ
jgi:hypothetical protein